MKSNTLPLDDSAGLVTDSYSRLELYQPVVLHWRQNYITVSVYALLFLAAIGLDKGHVSTWHGIMCSGHFVLNKWGKSAFSPSRRHELEFISGLIQRTRSDQG